MVYLDLACTLSVLFHGRLTTETSILLREAGAVQLSIIHRLQIENGIIRSIANPDRAAMSKKALLLWQRYLDEQVFQLQPFDLETAFIQAAAWNASGPGTPPKWPVLIHAAVALTGNRTFVSFDPALRKFIITAGGKVLPARLGP